MPSPVLDPGAGVCCVLRHISQTLWDPCTTWGSSSSLQSPLSMGFSWQEHWSVLSFPPPGIKLRSPASPTLADSLPPWHRRNNSKQDRWKSCKFYRSILFLTITNNIFPLGSWGACPPITSPQVNTQNLTSFLLGGYFLPWTSLCQQIGYFKLLFKRRDIFRFVALLVTQI